MYVVCLNCEKVNNVHRPTRHWALVEILFQNSEVGIQTIYIFFIINNKLSAYFQIVMKKVIKKFVCQFDMFEAPASFRIKDQPQMKTFTMGLLSLTLACFFVYIFIRGATKMFNYESIEYSESRKTIRSSDANGTIHKFALSLDFLNLAEFYSMFQFRAFQYKKGEVNKQIMMRPCLVEDWALLGQTYQQDFQSYDLRSMFCSQQSQFFLNETFRSSTPDYISIKLSVCNISKTPSCNITKAIQYIRNESEQYTSVQISLYILDKTIMPQKHKPINYFINIDTKTQITTKFGGAAVVEFSTFKVRTDENFMPWQSEVIDQGCRVDTVRNYQIDYSNAATDALGIVRLTMNQKQYLINRKVGKLNDVLSYAGGLFSIIIAILSFFLKSFNQYKYELAVAEETFNLDQRGEKIKQKDFNFFTYIKYSLYDWIQMLFCCKPNWKDCHKIHQTRSQMNGQLEANVFFRRINRIQNTLKLLTTKEELLCVNIICLPNIKQVQHDYNRLAKQYYQAITKDKSEITLSEVEVTPDLHIKGELYEEKQGTQLTNSNIMNRQIYSNNSEAILEGNRINQQIGRVNMDSMDRIRLVQKVIQKYPVLKEYADEANSQFPSQLLSIERKIGQSFWKLDINVRHIIQESSPLLILCRMLKYEPKCQPKSSSGSLEIKL